VKKSYVTITLKNKKLMKKRSVIKWLKFVNNAVNEDIQKRIKEGYYAYPFSV
jgi:hypothetical protein